jgi:hypothetical protein
MAADSTVRAKFKKNCPGSDWMPLPTFYWFIALAHLCLFVFSVVDTILFPQFFPVGYTVQQNIYTYSGTISVKWIVVVLAAVNVIQYFGLASDAFGHTVLYGFLETRINTYRWVFTAFSTTLLFMSLAVVCGETSPIVYLLISGCNLAICFICHMMDILSSWRHPLSDEALTQRVNRDTNKFHHQRGFEQGQRLGVRASKIKLFCICFFLALVLWSYLIVVIATTRANNNSVGSVIVVLFVGMLVYHLLFFAIVLYEVLSSTNPKGAGNNLYVECNHTLLSLFINLFAGLLLLFTS